jgi:hypothetical protein
MQLKAPEGDERRVLPRRQPAYGTLCQLASSAGDEICEGLVWNISASGVSMLLHKRLEPGTLVRAELRGPHNVFKLPIEIQVRHISKIETGDYVLGGQFARKLSHEEMAPFVA